MNELVKINLWKLELSETELSTSITQSVLDSWDFDKACCNSIFVRTCWWFMLNIQHYAFIFHVDNMNNQTWRKLHAPISINIFSNLK